MAKKTVSIQKELHFTATQLHLDPMEVEKISRNLNQVNGITAVATSQGRDLKITLVGRDQRDIDALEKTVVSKVRHAINRSKTAVASVARAQEDQSVLDYLRNRS